MMRRYFIEVTYDGTAFHGSQLQGLLPTVQLALNQALTTLLRIPVASFGASRTDEGVHALSNFYHFDTELSLHPQFRYKLNALLPSSLAVKTVSEAVSMEVNARFSAEARQYRYRIYRRKDPFRFHRAMYFPFRADREALDRTAEIIKVYTDFETFSKRNAQSKTFLCRIDESFWEQREDELHYVVRANRFLRGMVRGLVGTQLRIARGHGTPDDFRRIIEAKDCTRADFSVPGYGLYLEEIRYPQGALTELEVG